MSPDKPDKLRKFRDKYHLPYRLLSDVDHVLAKAYGVWVKKKLYGREYYGIDRSTFLVGGDGVIREIWRTVSVTGHVDAVLLAARELA